MPYGIACGLVAAKILGASTVSRIFRNGIFAPIFYICHYLLGFVVYIVMSVNLIGLFLFLAGLLRLLPAPLSCKADVAAEAIPLLFPVALSVHGAVHDAAMQIKPYEIQIEGQTQEKVPLRAALISGLHLGYAVGGHHLEEVTNAIDSIKPDLVCTAGDIFDGDTATLVDAGIFEELFLKVELVYSVYTYPENHDVDPDHDRITKFLSEAGVRVLRDEAVAIDNRFVLAGRKNSFPIDGQRGR